jgi:hypothetical protein
MTRNGTRVLEENWSDRAQGRAPAEGTGIWDVSMLVPPVLAANDYAVGVSIASPYQRFVDEEVLTFQLWPRPDDRRELSDRSRLVQPEVSWRLESRVPVEPVEGQSSAAPRASQ